MSAIGYSTDALKVMLLTGNFKRQTLLNVVNYQTIAVKADGVVVFPELVKKNLKAASMSPYDYVFQNQYQNGAYDQKEKS